MPTNDHVRADGRDPSASWENPDPSILAGPGDPPAFPLETLGPLETPTAQIAEATSAPVDYPANALLAIIFALVGRTRVVRIWHGWTEAIALWIALLGEPSASKSPPLGMLLGIVHQVEAERIASWEAEGRAAGEPMPRLLASDVTAEKLCAILRDNPGIALVSDELSRFLRGLCRYGNAAEGLVLESYGGRPYIVDRVKGGTLIVNRLLASIVGNIPPEGFRRLVLSRPDGFAARFQPVHPHPVPFRRPRTLPDLELIKRAMERPASLKLGSDGRPIVLDFCPGGADLMESWRAGDHAADMAAVRGRLAEHFNKLPGIAARTAAGLQHLWWCGNMDAPPPTEISEAAVAAALALVEGYYKPMARRVYGEAGMSDRELRVRALAEWIAATRPSMFNARTFGRTAGIDGLREPKAVDEAVKELVAAGWLRRMPPGRIGRHRKDYEVNPAVLAWLEARR